MRRTLLGLILSLLLVSPGTPSAQDAGQDDLQTLQGRMSMETQPTNKGGLGRWPATANGARETWLTACSVRCTASTESE